MKNKGYYFVSFFWAFIGLSLFFSCTQDLSGLADLGEAKIRIINASPEDAEISVSLNDTLKTPQPLKYSQSTGYQNTGAGNKMIKTSSNRQSLTNANLNFLLKNGKKYSVFVAGKISKDSLIYITLEDSFVGANDTAARVRFVNASQNSSNLEAVFSIKLTDSLANFASTGFRASTKYLPFKPGIYNIKVRQSISTPNLAVGSNFNMLAGKYYTIWMKGLISETGKFQLSPSLITDN